MHSQVLIAVCGGSGAGKTTVSSAIMGAAGQGNIAFVQVRTSWCAMRACVVIVIVWTA